MDEVSSILLSNDGDGDLETKHKMENFKVKYHLVESQVLGGRDDSSVTTSIKVSILKTCLNSLVRPVWEGHVNNICLAKYEHLPSFAQSALPEQSLRKTSSSGLSFPLMLGDTVDILQTEIKSLRQENQQLSEDTIRWKNTADKLVDQWQTEKNELTESFLVLFNEHKARHVATRKELEELKSNENNLPIGTVSSKQISRREADILPDNEDEHDHATWSDNLVKRLAAGPNKSRRGSREIDRYKSEEKEEASAARPTSTSEGTFVNPHTGVLEISNYKRMFDSDDDSDSPPKKKKTCDC